MATPKHVKIPNLAREQRTPSAPEASDKLVQQLMAGATQDFSPTAERHIGCSFCADPNIKMWATLVVDDPDFRLIFNRYILSTLKDLNQLSHFRAQLVHDIARILGRAYKSIDVVSLTWCILCRASARYFEKKGEANYWTYDQVDEQLRAWLYLLKHAFLPSPSSETRRIQLSALTDWRTKFVELQQRDQGPLLNCVLCPNKCLYRTEVSEVVVDARVQFDFNSAINSTERPASESAAWFCRLLCERLMGQTDVGLSYCLAAHFISNQQLSTDAQLVLLQKVLATLKGFAGEKPTQ